MLKYTIAFLKIHEQLLMINRQKSPWQGAWNGVGGKLEPGETPEACVIREIWEETGIVVHDPQFRGIVTWEPDKEPIQGMYVFLANISAQAVMDLPRATREGILALKDISWILSEDNFGIVPSIRFFLKHTLDETKRPADYHCTFEGDEIVRAEIRPLHDRVLR
ncbi:NUDIX hydrolase [Sporolactobacillus terrae]|uniref:NUDIX hydrolase n=1 Tax=Sporolactobacillus terrae TaxID=269673 RepID=UPI00048F4E88|nr:8-oxo-dGTP diphosphatase [Sporolactobacillus terrae]